MQWLRRCRPVRQDVWSPRLMSLLCLHLEDGGQRAAAGPAVQACLQSMDAAAWEERDGAILVLCELAPELVQARVAQVLGRLEEAGVRTRAGIAGCLLQGEDSSPPRARRAWRPAWPRGGRCPSAPTASTWAASAWC
jgi:hypothetical protein